MALDGIVLANIAYELKNTILNGRIDKVQQPEKDEILIGIRAGGVNYKLLMTASASHPRAHLTARAKESPLTAPLFCMVLRKHLAGGRITGINQPGFERILNIKLESADEMGDFTEKTLVIEIMGKHSNIILINSDGVIIDSIKHITFEKSSVREVLPGKEYQLPPSKDKISPVDTDKNTFYEKLNASQGIPVQKAIFGSFSGISPVMAEDICLKAGINPNLIFSDLPENKKEMLFDSFSNIMLQVNKNEFHPHVYYNERNEIIDFSSLEMIQFESLRKASYSSVSELLDEFYEKKDIVYRSLQKSQDLKKIVQNLIERCVKKKDIQIKTLRDIENRDTYRLYGELLTANIYAVKKGMTSFETVNFYSDSQETITIPLNPDKTPSENCQIYFKRYGKEKRTFAALQDQIRSSDEEMTYLGEVLNSVSIVKTESDCEQIREELAAEGFIKKKKAGKGKPKPKKNKPMKFISSDGFEIYVGKNNTQNDELTLKFADGHDIWLHTKDIPGSHVILRTNGVEPSITALNEAANLAACFSKGKDSSQVAVDYTVRKNIKKPAGAKPGMVIYENHKTAYITPAEPKIKQIE